MNILVFRVVFYLDYLGNILQIKIIIFNCAVRLLSCQNAYQSAVLYGLLIVRTRECLWKKKHQKNRVRLGVIIYITNTQYITYNTIYCVD